MVRTLQELRSFAVGRTMFPPTTLSIALDRLGFVQADPIRAPARAQDLILRHRVVGYHVNDLDRWYASGDVEEGVLYAYGFLRRGDWQLLRNLQSTRLSQIERKILELVKEKGPSSANDIKARIGHARAINDWGRQSSAATVFLERLRRCGLLRIAERHQGVKRYAVAPDSSDMVSSPEERYQRLILLVVRVLSPLPEKTLRRVVARFRRIVPEIQDHRPIIDGLYRRGDLIRQRIDGADYVWLSDEEITSHDETQVRLLTPFDPLVWDRLKFQHLWGWEYRFEAYTEPAKRIRGHYAMPLLFRNSVIGWANAALVDERLRVELGFVNGRRPSGAAFTAALDREIADMETFLVSKGNR